MAHRCHVCDRTDDRRLTLYPEQYFKGPYRRDKFSENVADEVCQECEDIARDTLQEFYTDTNDEEDYENVVTIHGTPYEEDTF